MKFDILIAGASLAGVTAALALANTDYTIALVEAKELDDTFHLATDTRSLFLSPATQGMLQSMGIWHTLASHACPVHRVHISERGHFGGMRLDRDDDAKAVLGYVVTHQDLWSVLSKSLAETCVKCLTPTRITTWQVDAQQARLRVEHRGIAQQFSTRLLIAADGTASTLRTLAHIPLQRQDYGQTALVTTLATDKPHRHSACLRFGHASSCTLLPLCNTTGDTAQASRYALLWILEHPVAAKLARQTESEFMTTLQQHLGRRLGRITGSSPRRIYPLHGMYAPKPYTDKTVCIGNAACTLHPITAQGFNLALRDITTLVDLLKAEQSKQNDPGSLALLHTYHTRRHAEQMRVYTETDHLAQLLTSRTALSGFMRGMGLTLLDSLDPLRYLITQRYVDMTT